MWRWEQIAEWLKEPKLGAELGVKEGRFTQYLLQKFPTLHMVAVDLWQEKPSSTRRGFETYKTWDFGKIQADYRLRTAPFQDRLTTMQCDTVKAAESFVDGTFDFVFIDAEHTYEAVKADIAAWLPKIRSGGLLSGHDYSGSFPGVCDAVNEMKRKIIEGTDKVWAIRVD